MGEPPKSLPSHMQGSTRPSAARSPVADKALTVSLATRPVFLIVKVLSELLFKARRDCHERSHPLRLRRLSCRDHIEPGANGAPGGYTNRLANNPPVLCSSRHALGVRIDRSKQGSRCSHRTQQPSVE